jgi:hypothetical protein
MTPSSASRIALLAAAGVLAIATPNASKARRDRGVNQPGAMGKRGGVDPGMNQPGVAGNRR